MYKPLIESILTSDVLTIPPNILISQAIDKMARNKISCLVVEENDKVVGIVTERDIIYLKMRNVSFEDKQIKEIMSTPVVKVAQGLDIFEAYHILSVNKIRHLVVTKDDGRIMGIVTQSDIIKSLGLELEEIRVVSRIMSKQLVVVSTEDKLSSAVHKMAEMSLSCVIVEKDKKGVGIITERDIIRLMNEKTDFQNVIVKYIMTKPLITVDFNTPLSEVTRVMAQRKIRRVVVVDDEGIIVGLTTQSDLIKGVLEGKYIDALKEIIQKSERELRKKERSIMEKTIFLDSILYSAKELAIISTDMDLNINFFNAEAEKIFNCSSARVLTKPVKTIFSMTKTDVNLFEKRIRNLSETEEYMDIVAYERGKLQRFLGIKVSSIHDLRHRNKLIRGYVIMAKDITERRREEDILKESEQKYRSIFENSKDAVYMTALDGSFLEINLAGSDLFGFSQKDILEMNIKDLYHNPGERDKFLRLIQKNDYVKDYKIDFIDRQNRTIHGVVTAVTQKDKEGNVIGFQGIIRDETEKKKQDELISHMAFHDALTGLPNRHTFFDRLRLEIAHTKRHKKMGAIMFIDLDDFKMINDTYGHNVGDLFLKGIAKRLKGSLRADDTVSRIGGDEFTIIMSEITSVKDCKILAKKIMKAFKRPLKINDLKLNASMSMGLSVFPLEGENPEELVKKADNMMYEVKHTGKNNFKI
ncbi:MAG: diguanylate cyclase [Nitrospinae bacterium]|nr:diguanylate cyclase [Nitrospinota bacterium]